LSLSFLLLAGIQQAMADLVSPVDADSIVRYSFEETGPASADPIIADASGNGRGRIRLQRDGSGSQ